MLKFIAIITTIITLHACAYTPVIDTAGRSDSTVESSARDITNDLQHCKALAEANSSVILDSTPKAVWNYYLRAYSLYILPERESDYKAVYKACMSNRGHSVIK